MTGKHTLNLVAFRLMFPQFVDETKYPDALLSGYFSMATCAIYPEDNCIISGDCLQLVLDLMTAHILTLLTAANTGNGTVGFQTGAAVGDVSVNFAPPPYKNGWQFYLSKTPFGEQIWILLSVHAVGGDYIGGAPELEPFTITGGYHR